MKSVAARRFWSLFEALPPEIQRSATEAYRLWLKTPVTRPSVSGAPKALRIVSLSASALIIVPWAGWIGSRADYDKLTG